MALKQFFNDAQAYMLFMSTNNLIAECGRGLGKGVVQAERCKENAQFMPGSNGGFVSPSVKRCLTNILPSLLIHFERWGYKRDIHYTVGKKPWRALHWKSPLFTPDNWENTLSFYNGTVCNIISQDRPGTSNSMSLDWLLIDEAKFVKFEQLKNETFQAMRGNNEHFGRCWLHHGMTITSDTPVTKEGSWFFRYEKMMDPELVQVIEGLIYQRWIYRQRIKECPDKVEYYQKQIERIEAQLTHFRSKCLLYKRYSSIENLAILGVDYIKRMKRDLPVMTFATSVMCQRVGISADGFYGGLRPDINLYTSPNIDYMDTLTFNGQSIVNDCRTDMDVIQDLPLIISFDANANINWLVVGQVGYDNKYRILKSFYVKYERKLPELINDFCNYYKYYKFKRVVFYYDSTFVGTNYALHNDDFHSFIEKQLRLQGWFVDAVFIGAPMGHIDKNALINRMFRGKANHQILINRDNNQDLLLSIQSAGVYNGKKDKRGEKLVETEEDKLESRTDGSDAFDTGCIGIEKFPKFQFRASMGVVSSFGGE